MKSTFTTLAIVSLIALTFAGAVKAAPARNAKNVALKIEPLKADDSEKKQEARMNAVNRALEQSLTERAKSQNDFERTAKQVERKDLRGDRVAIREQINERAHRASDLRLDSNSREVRAVNRELREESKREKRLNWLND